MTYRGHVQNGVVVFDEPLPLPEGAQVRVEVLSEEAQPGEAVAGHESATLNERLHEVIGAARGLPPDASLNVDHYLYSAPKRS